MSSVHVVEVTRAAGADSLTDAEYHEIFDELRGKHSLRDFVILSQTRYSIAWWSKIERGAMLTRDARNDLRRAVGLAPLPPTVAQATASARPTPAISSPGGSSISRRPHHLQSSRRTFSGPSGA